MNPNMRCHLKGKFVAQDLKDGTWRLSRGDLEPAEVLLRGADSHAPEVLASPDLRDLDVEWQDVKAELRATSSGRRITLGARSAIVHEPLARLYDGLPLARTTPESRRFWRRVFCLVRIPGGRFLLAAMARRTRARSLSAQTGSQP
ncbi:MAG: hypothetical protein WA803_17455 [Steroidobacteraceae bacterium]